MNDTALRADTRDIVLDEVFPHAPETLWKALTTGELVERWLMKPTGFKPERGNRFTYQTTAAGAWDGVIHCEVLEVVPNQCFVYAWRGGHAGNAGYGASLDTVVTFTLIPVAGGTRLRLVHAGFITPTNDTAYQNMSGGWPKVFRQLDTVVTEHEPARPLH